MSTDPGRRISFEGREIPYGTAERWVILLEHAATTAVYAATSEHWPGYVAWLEQQTPALDLAGGSEPARLRYEADAIHLIRMAAVARRNLERAAGTGEH